MTALSPHAAPAPLVAPTVVLRPRHGWQRLALPELWRYRDLLRQLALRDISVRYKQTFLGAAWALLQPVVTMVVLSVVFGQLLGAQTKTGGIPYPVFLYAGLLPWTLFAGCITAASGSLVGNASLLSKVYFPRLVLPVAALGAPLVDYAIAALVLVGLMLWYGIVPGALLLMLPLLVASTLLAALGVGVLLAALTVTYRDFRYVVPFLLQVWFFITPVIVPESAVPASLRWLIALNPMGGLIGGFRAAVLGQPLDVTAWLASTACAVLLLLVGLTYFHRAEPRFADVV